MTVTQASLSPDLESNLPAEPDVSTPMRAGLGSEATLWLFGLTALTLVFASLLLLGLLAQNVLADAAVSGAVTATAAITAMLGLGAMAYVLSAARRAGYLTASVDVRGSVGSTASVAVGLIQAPAIPAGLGAKRRLEVEAQREIRNRQARAIRSAGSDGWVPSPTGAPAGYAHSPASDLSLVAPVHAPRPAAPVTVRPRPPAPVRVRPAAAATPRPVVRMPGDGVGPRPAVPAFLHMHRQPLYARTGTALLQIQAAASRPSARTAPWSVEEVPGHAPVYRPPQPDRAA